MRTALGTQSPHFSSGQRTADPEVLTTPQPLLGAYEQAVCFSEPTSRKPTLASQGPSQVETAGGLLTPCVLEIASYLHSL